jgi:hypothetical protein
MILVVPKYFVEIIKEYKLDTYKSEEVDRITEEILNQVVNN